MTTEIDMFDIFYERKNVDQYFTETFYYNGNIQTGTRTQNELNELIDKSESCKRKMKEKLTKDQYDQAADRMLKIRLIYRKKQKKKEEI